MAQANRRAGSRDDDSFCNDGSRHGQDVVKFRSNMVATWSARPRPARDRRSRGIMLCRVARLSRWPFQAGTAFHE